MATVQTDREQFLAERLTGIGGSDIDDLFNLPPYGCRRKLWYEKRRAVPDYPFFGNNQTERGQRLEDVAATVYSEKTGRTIRRVLQLKRDKERPYLIAHLDRQIVKNDRGPGSLSLKCPNSFVFRKAKRDGVGDGYILQIQHEIGITNWQWGAFGLFCADQWDMIHFDVDRDESLITEIRKAGESFWREVEFGPAPEKLKPEDRRCQSCPFRTQCQGEALYGGTSVDSADVPVLNELAPLCRELQELQQLESEAGELVSAKKEAIKTLMGELALADTEGFRVLYRTQKGSEYFPADSLKKLKAQHPELAKELVKEKKGSRPLFVYAR